MKKSRIAIKLFILTAIVFILFISITLVLQVLFFEKYYISKKTSSFEGDFKQLASSLCHGTIDQNKAIQTLYRFDESNGSKSLIMNITELNLGVFGTVKTGVNYIIPPSSKDSNGDITPVIRESIGIAQSQYYDYIVKGMHTLIYKKDVSGISYIFGAAPIIQNGDVNNVLFTMVSLQPVGEAVSATKSFYIYIYIFALALIIILSFLYSIMISKPLIKLKSAASKMTELDFSTKCEIKSKDEIGELGGILNFLSDKLDNTLTELKASNDKLKEDIEKERQIEIMRKEFVAGVSHELKTPITLIGGYAEALKDGIVDPPDRDFFVDVILDESNKMNYLIKDMLDLSQLESGYLKMEFEDLNITDLLNFVIKKFTKKMQSKNIIVETEASETNGTVRADVMRIEQVLVNLISNAIRHVPEGGKINCKIDKYEHALRISIENDGDNIPEEELEKIWERFYKIDKSRNREAEGTGIGLSIVKNILQLHNSEFGVQNTDRGVRFYFTLNLSESKEG